MNYDLIKNEERSKGILNEKNLIQKENFSLKNKITDITQESNDKDLNFEKMNADLSAAHTQNQKLKKDNEDLKYKNTILDKEYQRLINDIDNKLIQFPIKSFDNNINASSFMNNDGKENFNNVTTLTTNKIIHKIDSLIYLNKEINKQLSDVNRENKMCKDKINDLQNENFLMKDKIQNYEENVQKEINNFKNRKENEYNETKEVLFNKIKTLNSILESSLQDLKTRYENAINEVLKNTKEKLGFTYNTGLEWDLIKKQNDTFLDKVNSTFAIKNTEFLYNQAINDIDSISAQVKLKNVMN
jgi:chromosome segregation ATPase